MRKYCIYKHTNLLNGKIYIGQTCQIPTRRWKNGHSYKKGTYFGNAILKYGWENFYHEILENELTKEQADEREKYYIKELRTFLPNIGYNRTLGGEGCIPNAETRKKMRLSFSKKTQEEKRNIVEKRNAWRNNEEKVKQAYKKQTDTKYEHTEIVIRKGETIFSFNSVTDVSNFLNVSRVAFYNARKKLEQGNFEGFRNNPDCVLVSCKIQNNTSDFKKSLMLK